MNKLYLKLSAGMVLLLLILGNGAADPQTGSSWNTDGKSSIQIFNSSGKVIWAVIYRSADKIALWGQDLTGNKSIPGDPDGADFNFMTFPVPAPGKYVFRVVFSKTGTGLAGAYYDSREITFRDDKRYEWYIKVDQAGAVYGSLFEKYASPHDDPRDPRNSDR